MSPFHEFTLENPMDRAWIKIDNLLEDSSRGRGIARIEGMSRREILLQRRAKLKRRETKSISRDRTTVPNETGPTPLSLSLSSRFSNGIN